MKLNKRDLGFALAFASCLFSGVIPVASRVFALQMPPLELVFMIHLFQIPVLALIFKSEKTRIPKASDLSGLLLISAYGLGGVMLVTFAYSLASGSAIEGGFLSRTEPVFAALFAWLFLREKMSSRQWIGLGCGAIGAYFFSNGGPLGLGITSLLFLLAAISWGISDAAAKKFSGKISPAAMNMARCVFASLVLLPFGLAVFSRSDLLAGGFLLALLYLGSNYLLYEAMKHIKAGEAASFLLLAPVITVLLSTVFLSEAMTFQQATSGLALAASIYLVARG